jgi:uncharacterized protein YndB with AHSA1/START domain
MAKYEGSRETTAPPDVVWRIWSDPTTWRDWNPDVEDASAEGPLRSGTKGAMTTKSGGQHDIVFEDVVDGRAFTVVAGPMPATKFHFRCEIAPADGGSRISQSLMLHGLLAFMSGMIAPRVVETFGPLLDGLAKKAEAPG